MKKLVLSLAAALVVGAGTMVLTTGGQKAEAGCKTTGSIWGYCHYIPNNHTGVGEHKCIRDTKALVVQERDCSGNG